MPDDAGEVIIQLLPDSSGRWQVVPLSVGEDVVLEMLPNPGSSESSISRRTRDRLLNTPHLVYLGQNGYILRDLAVEGQILSDLEVRVHAGPALLGVDGILGYSFFRKFVAVLWEPRSNRLRLFDA